MQMDYLSADLELDEALVMVSSHWFICVHSCCRLNSFLHFLGALSIAATATRNDFMNKGGIQNMLEIFAVLV